MPVGHLLRRGSNWTRDDMRYDFAGTVSASERPGFEFAP